VSREGKFWAIDANDKLLVFDSANFNWRRFGHAAVLLRPAMNSRRSFDHLVSAQ